MAALSEIVGFLDAELNTAAIPDYPGAMNGLQLENEGAVGRLIAAVDASLSVIEAAAAGGPGLLIVHHGMFWQGGRPFTGALYRKLKIAIDADLAIYSSHLPLDVHPKWGNNQGLAEAIGLECPTPFLEKNGICAGFRGRWTGTREELTKRLEAAVGGPVHLCPGGKKQISTVGLITGGAGGEVAAVAATGVDAFITGEGAHWTFPLAEELGLNLYYAGHYATETFGVRSLIRMLSERFGLTSEFIDRPTGL